MGTWGTAVDADDTFQDVIGAFDHHLKRNQSIEATTKAVLASFSEELDLVEAQYLPLSCRWVG